MPDHDSVWDNRPDNFFQLRRDLRFMDWDKFDEAVRNWDVKSTESDNRDMRDPQELIESVQKLREKFPELKLSEILDLIETLKGT